MRFDPTTGPSLGARLVPGDTLVPYDETIKYVHDQGLVGYSDVVTGTTLADHSNLLNDARVWSVCAGFLEE